MIAQRGGKCKAPSNPQDDGQFMTIYNNTTVNCLTCRRYKRGYRQGIGTGEFRPFSDFGENERRWFLRLIKE